MNVGELFVSISVKGAQKAVDSLSGVKKALLDVSSQGLAAKAAVFGILYGLERFASSSLAAGTNLKQFANNTGLSTDMLQRWQYVMRQSGVSAEETQSSIENLQLSLGKMLNHGQAISGYGQVNSLVGLEYSKLSDPYYVIKKLQEYLRKETNVTRAMEAVQSFGLTPNVAGALKSGKLRPEDVPSGAILSQNSINSLFGKSVQWDNLGRQFELLKNRITAGPIGTGVLDTLQNATKLLFSMEKIVEKLTKSFPAFGNVAKAAFLAISAALIAMGGPLTALSAAVSGIILLMGEWQKHKDNKESIFGDKDFKGNILTNSFDAVKNFITGAIAPTPPASALSGKGNTSFNINQTNHGVKDAKESNKALVNQINRAHKTSAVQKRGT